MLFLTHHFINVSDIDADDSDVIDVMSLTANSISDDEDKSATGMMIPPVRQLMNPENPTLIQFFTIYIMIGLTCRTRYIILIKLQKSRVIIFIEPEPPVLEFGTGSRKSARRMPTLTQSVFPDFINSRFKTFY